MTDKSDGSDPEFSSPGSNPEQQPVESETAKAESETAKQDAQFALDELPEEEELTPELIEEEAIRGDFMLRWAAIFLTVLFGFGLIADTQSLVHIRSGEYLASNGFLPYQPDGLSYAVGDATLSNTAWLFDIVIAQVYGIGGVTGLTVFKVLIAGLIAWLLSQVSIRMMPTWWSSICCVLAAAAFSIDLFPITDMVTLLGLTITLLWLHKSTEGTISGLHWKLAILIAIWANLDPRAYLGTFAVVLFALGTKLSGHHDEPESSSPEGVAFQPSKLGLAAALSFAALLINPFPIASVLSAVNTYSVEYPNLAAMKTVNLNAAAIQDGRSEYFSLLSGPVWHSFEFSYLAGICLLVIALIVLLLNRSRQDLRWALPLLGFFFLTLIAVRELPAAALVAAVIAGTSAQRWYGRTFRQEYSIDTAEVMFSRGGRAVTVFGMALLGFCVVADRLPTRTAIGIGFDPQLEATMTSLSAQLADVPVEDHLFNTKLQQGDLLIWDGRKSFVDSRVRLFGRREARSSVMRNFEVVRQSMLPPPPPKEGTDPAEVPVNPFYDAGWKQIYDDLNIKQVMIRLSPPGIPAYVMTSKFNRNRNWIPASRGPSAACFRYSSLGNERPDFSIADFAFQQDEEATDETVANLARFEYAQPATFYQKYLYLERPPASASLREAEHVMSLDAAPDQLAAQLVSQSRGNLLNANVMANLGHLLAAPLVAIRRTNQTLAEDPNNLQAYRIQALAYRRLSDYEQMIAQVNNGQALPTLRYYQSLMATHQCLTVDPNQPQLILDLANQFQRRGRLDLSLNYIDKFLEMSNEEELANNPKTQELFSSLEARKKQLATAQEQCLEWLVEREGDDLPEEPQRLAQYHYGVASTLNNRGFVLKALEYMQQHDALLQPLPPARVLKGQILLEVGELSEAFLLLNGVAEVAQDSKYRQEYAGIPWQFPVAVSHLGKAAYDKAAEAFESQYTAVGLTDGPPPQVVQAMLKTLPLVPAVETAIQTKVSSWPLMQLNSSQFPMISLPSAKALPLLRMAVLNLEAGRIDEAQKQLKELTETTGDSPYLALAAVYLQQLGEDARKELIDSRLNPFTAFEFPEIAGEETAPSEEKDAGSEEKAAGSQEPDGDAEEPQPAMETPSADQGTDAGSEKEEAAEQKAPEQKATESQQDDTGDPPSQDTEPADNSEDSE